MEFTCEEYFLVEILSNCYVIGWFLSETAYNAKWNAMLQECLMAYFFWTYKWLADTFKIERLPQPDTFKHMNQWKLSKTFLSKITL